MNISSGVIPKAQKLVLYGVEGIGKSTFAAQAPEVVFIDTEDSTAHMDVKRFDKPTSWTMLRQQVAYIKANPTVCKTLAIDTADWAERLAIEHIISSKSQNGNIKGIEDFGYGKGYVYLEEEFGRLLNDLQELIELGINIVITAHSEIKKVEQPEEIGGYDHWQMKLEKKTMPLLKEWADVLIFANYKTMVVNVDNQGAVKGKNKAQGNQRVMYTTRTPWWDGKNRHNLPDELPFDFNKIAHIFKNASTVPQETKPVQQVAPPKEQIKTEEVKQAPLKGEPSKNEDDIILGIDSSIPDSLAQLMKTNRVSTMMIQEVVGQKGYYPADTPIANYDPDFINGVLVAAWEQVYGLIKENNKNLEVEF